MRPSFLQQAHDWLWLAEEDLGSATDCLSLSPPRLGVATYRSQQADEKALKAVLTAYGQPIEMTHNLERLTTQCMNLDASIASLVGDARSLNPFATRIRYPVSGQPLRPSEADARVAVQRAAGIVAFARHHLFPSPPPQTSP
jgi:HEPN domain-containing protein